MGLDLEPLVRPELLPDDGVVGPQNLLRQLITKPLVMAMKFSISVNMTATVLSGAA